MEMLIFEKRLHVDIPDSFGEMEKDRIAMMYPYEEQPQIALEEEETHRFCTFSLLETQALSEGQTEPAIRLIAKVITGLYPSCLLDKPQLADCQEGKCGWFSFQTAGMEGKIWNIMYIFSVNGCMMLGTLGCLAEDEPGKKQMMKIMKSLKNVRKQFSSVIAGRR